MPERRQRCPACHRAKTRKQGVSRRGVRQYQCLNPRCATNWFIDPDARKPPQERAVYMRAYRAKQRLQGAIRAITTIGPCMLVHADCLEVLPLLQHGTVMCTDPSYGFGYEHKRSRDTLVHPQRVPTPMHGYTTPWDPIPWLALQIPKMVVWGGNYYADKLPLSAKWLVWDKLAGKTPHSGADCELAWTNLKGPTRIFSHLWRGTMRAGEENVKSGGLLHPHQKPVRLMRWCLQEAEVDPATDLVIDPYMGSGTIAVACFERGISYIGVEIDAACYQIAVKRLQRHAYWQARKAAARAAGRGPATRK